MVKRSALFAVLGLAAIMALGNAPNWTLKVALTDGGHLFGNPDAKVSLIEWVSYTCPHCAGFSRDGDGALQIAYVGPGKINREIRHIVRDPVDLTAAMLTNCGPPAKFHRNHAAIMFSQSEWLPLLDTASSAQRARWHSGDHAARRRAIASDFGFYAIMERRGYRRTEIDRCLADGVRAKNLADNSQKDSEKYFVKSTPSFAIDGILLAGTHDWSLLEPQLKARLPAS